MWSNKINLKIVVWGTIIGGFISSLVKWGSEVNMPRELQEKYHHQQRILMRGLVG